MSHTPPLWLLQGIPRLMDVLSQQLIAMTQLDIPIMKQKVSERPLTPTLVL